MKRLAIPILFLALILPVVLFTGCSTGDDALPDDNQAGNLGEGPLVLKGKLYTETVNRSAQTVDYDLFTSPGTINAWVSGYGIVNTAALTDGEFDISISENPTDLYPFDSDTFADTFNRWGDVAVEPADTLGARARLVYISEQDASFERNIFRQDTVLSTSPWLVSRSVEYLYVENDAIITLDEKTETVTDSNNRDYSNIGRKSVIRLKKGWNVLTARREQDGSTDGYYNNFTMSIDNPEVYWVIYN
jgi:hypothetical protein